jgi:perosamine synthetase
MSNISAAVGLIQLKKFDRMNRRKIEVARRYDAAFGDIEGIDLLRNNGYIDIGLFVYILKIRNGRNELMNHLGSKGVGSGIHYIPSHVFSFYKKDGISLPITEQIYDEILTLPLFPDITDAQVETVVDAVISGMAAG